MWLGTSPIYLREEPKSCCCFPGSVQSPSLTSDLIPFCFPFINFRSLCWPPFYVFSIAVPPACTALHSDMHRVKFLPAFHSVKCHLLKEVYLDHAFYFYFY